VGAAAVGARGIEQDSLTQLEGADLAAEALALPRALVVVTGDEQPALRGAFPDRPGIVLISGTGMICVGRGGLGHGVRSGGWGCGCSMKPAQP